ncbi:cytochrome P450 [Streptomyces sp. YIM 98790]|uniref:cytochrome P450 n=1 Tax=Streptomyces sp. YIM 98790 TaxID=2689077 RepID=UPI00140BCF88|nr:cytochrome P450 [Streptomyces sp. YIM 98790]
MPDNTPRTAPPGPGAANRPVAGRAPAVPGAWPLIGHAPRLVLDPLRFITSLPRYGDVALLRIGTMPLYAVNHPALVNRVLVDDARSFERGRFFEKARPILGQGLLAASGAEHRRQRRRLQPAFHAARIAGYAPVMRAAAESATAAWRPGQVIQVDREMNDLSLAMLMRSLFAGDVGTEAAERFQRALPVVSRELMVRVAMPSWWASLPTPANRRFTRAIEDLNTAIGTSIAAYRRGGLDPDGLLSLLLAPDGGEDGERFTGTQVRDQVLNFAVAGVETVGASQAWLFHELGRNPGVEARVHAELDRVLGGRPPEYRDLPALDYTHRVVKETLRVHAPWLLMRRANRDVRLGDVDVPAGSEVCYSPHMLHHDPRWYPEPGRFDPDRWLPERTADRPRNIFFPFGTGAHKCMGDSFALTEMAVATAVICSRWRLRPVPGVKVKEVARADVHPSRLPMTAEPRTPAA